MAEQINDRTDEEQMIEENIYHLFPARSVPAGNFVRNYICGV